MKRFYFVSVIIIISKLCVGSVEINELEDEILSENKDDIFRSWKFSIQHKCTSDPECNMTVPQIIQYYGYKPEIHKVQTKDGYILDVHRIAADTEPTTTSPTTEGQSAKPNVTTVSSKKSSTTTRNSAVEPRHGHLHLHRRNGRPVILLLHGVLSSSAQWILNFPNQSLPFILSDMGYDVWLGNTRGNTYGRHHVKLSPNNPRFWQFSFEQMGKYDLPNTIDYITKETGQKKIYIIGHSLGCAVIYSMLSEKTDYNKKVRLVVCMAPGVLIGHSSTPLKIFARHPLENIIELLGREFGYWELLPVGTVPTAVKPGSIKYWIAKHYVFPLFGTENSYIFNSTRLPLYLSHYPAGTSLDSVIHLAQMLSKQRFQHFDKGILGNYIHYRRSQPPEFPLEKITVPNMILYSNTDKLTTAGDIQVLASRLKRVDLVVAVNFSHGDFVWGTTAKKEAWDKFLFSLPKY